MEVSKKPLQFTLVSNLPASLISAVGAALFLVLPLALGTAADAYDLSGPQLGVLGSIYLGGFTLATLALAVFIDMVPWRRTCILAGILLSLAMFGTPFSSGFAGLSITFSLAGLGAGTLYSISTRVIGDAPDPDRGFGIKLMAEQILGAALLFTIPMTVMSIWGMQGLFTGLGAVFLAMTPLAILLPANKVRKTLNNISTGTKVARSPGIFPGIFALALFMAGLSSLWAFFERLGMDAGLERVAIGQALSVGLVFGIFGAGAAAVVGDRFGGRYPHILGGLMFLVALVLASSATSVPQYVLAACFFSGAWNYCLAYQLGSIAKLDIAGDYIAWLAPAIAVGATFGPVIGGMLKSGPSYTPLIVFAFMSVAIATVVFFSWGGTKVTSTREHT